MAAPVAVRQHTDDSVSAVGLHGARGNTSKALPPVSSFAFADILRAADSADFQTAIEGIAEICAKNRMSLADEHSSHIPPLGEVTIATPAAMRPHLLRPGMRRALTSVPEASSGSSEGSRPSKKRRSGLFGFKRQQYEQTQALRQIRIGKMGREISVTGTTSIGGSFEFAEHNAQRESDARGSRSVPAPSGSVASEATLSLQRLLARPQSAEG